ncbi:MAG: TolC family protein, partial [Pseudomonadota bacterium]|nr:TolC family protein [Pseudomonadota bacterium]
ARTKRLFDAGSITGSEMAQAESVLERVELDEETAILSYIEASNDLAERLDMQSDSLLVPTGYTSALKNDMLTVEATDEILANPAYVSQAVALNIAKAIRDTRIHQTRPDVTASGYISLNQSNAIFGYEDWEDSWGHLFNPDSLTTTAALAYNYPLFNRAIEAMASESRLGFERARLAMRQTALDLQQTLESSAANLEAARARVGITARGAKLSESVYDRALRMQEMRRVSEYEVAQRLVDLLGARQTEIDARIALKQAETNMAATYGILPRLFGEMTAQTAADMKRLRLLAESGRLQHFGE